MRQELQEIKNTQSAGEPYASLVDEEPEAGEAESPGEATPTKDVISEVLSELKETLALDKALDDTTVLEVPKALEDTTKPETPSLSLDPEKPPIVEIPPSSEPTAPPTSYPSLSDDPSEAQVAKQCSDIVVHDITLPVDVETGDSDTAVQMKDLGSEPTPNALGSNPALGTEVKYDNVDVIKSTDTGVSAERTQQMKKLLTMASDVKGKPDISVVKKPNIQPATPTPEPAPAPTPSFSLSNLYPNMGASKPAPAPIDPTPAPEPKITPLDTGAKGTEAKPETRPSEPKSPRVEVAEIKSEEINDTDSLAGFLNDVKQIVEDKGIKVDTSNKGMFTLFEDASEVEK